MSRPSLRYRLRPRTRILAGILGIGFLAVIPFTAAPVARLVLDSPRAWLSWAIAAAILAALPLGWALAQAAYTGVDLLTTPPPMTRDLLPEGLISSEATGHTPPSPPTWQLEDLVRRAPLEKPSTRAATQSYLLGLLREAELLSSELHANRLVVWPPSPALEARIRDSLAIRLEERRHAVASLEKALAQLPSAVAS